MKKILLKIMVGSLLASSAAYAQEPDIVCQVDKVVQFLDQNRYLMVSGTNNFPFILADTQSIKIDRRNKTVKVLSIMIASVSGREDMIKSLSKYGLNYNNFGYTKSLSIFNYQKMENQLVTRTEYNCDGTIATPFEKGNKKWEAIMPGSYDEEALQTIIKKYTLK
jgi:hypothetical protein